MQEALPVVSAPGDATSTVHVLEIADLAAIHEAHVRVVSLRRSVLPTLARYAERIVREQPFQFRSVVACEEDGGLDALDDLVKHLPPDDARDVLVQDIAFWIEVVTCLSGLPRCGVRLACLDERMCPRFHVDQVPFRLLCTYAGSGTEWLDERDVDRSMPIGFAVKRGAKVQRAGRMDVTLLKDAVHRSPDCARPRLLLTLEPVG